MTQQAKENPGSTRRRLRADLKSTAPDDLIREFARDTLKAQRMSASYLDTLSIVLGNQADAEIRGQSLEMNIRAGFSTQRTMRTIIDQMKDAGITQDKQIHLGQGRTQVVQCFTPPPLPRMNLNDYLRAEENHSECRRRSAVLPPSVPDAIASGDVPF